MTQDHENSPTGPVALAYDGSALAKLAIDEAGRQLAPRQTALVLTVWQPFDVGFVPAVELRINAAEIANVRNAAEQTAAQGASLAQAAGFHARSAVVDAAPTWKGIVQVADEHDARRRAQKRRNWRQAKPASMQKRLTADEQSRCGVLPFTASRADHSSSELSMSPILRHRRASSSGWKPKC
jgi:hypothetical protein